MRLFVSLTLPEAAIGPLLDLQDRLPIGRPVSADNLHLTLAFLGDQPEAALEGLHDALSTLRAAPVPLVLSGAALFGGRKGQAAGLEADGGAALTALHDRIKARLHGAGVHFERRRFRPHVTLTRLKGGADASRVLSVLAGAHIGPVTCTGFALVESRLHPDGAIYEPLACWPLG
ncbi:RNA 2',3'-cyclic phosphodiesterase [Sagittula salina]|uniref:RNA 2',3'-cyclic phosphodiesterase n=1 Tax=Sagittula salina TaxID=2820268 RepID=A0A940MR29_9RHOB|nr:RNA 2',3'-cyclic phosphodiesterase [Sagittula salina]